MGNSIDKVTVYNKIIDDALEAGITSQALTANSAMVQYNGGNTVKIAKMSTTGFGNYSRDGASSFPAGGATLEWETFTIRFDRAIEFQIDVMDMDETASIATTAAFMANFAKYNEVPEIDATRYSCIWGGVVNDTTPRFGFMTASASTILTQIKTDISAMRNIIGDQESLTLYMAGNVYGILSNSTELSKQLQITDMPVNGINTQVQGIDRVPIVPVPSARLMTEYLFKAGDAVNGFGFAARTWAKQIDYILIASSAVAAINKHAATRYFPAGVNQMADKDKVQSRLFHDCWVFEKKRDGVFIRLESSAIVSMASVFGSGAVAAGSGKITVTLGSYLDLLPAGYKVYAKTTDSASAPTVPAAYDDIDVSGYTEITAKTATDIAVTATHYGVVVLVTDGGKVVAFESAVATA